MSHTYYGLMLPFLLLSCTTHQESSQPINNATPVTVTQVQTGSMQEVVELNATATFQVKTAIKSSVNGYVQRVNAAIGEPIQKGKLLVVIQSKEAQNLGNTVNKLDSTFQFDGTTRLTAPCHGFITEWNNRPGDYVQDGEVIGTISDLNSLVFLLEMPYGLTPYLPNNKTVTLTLPDETTVKGRIALVVPSVDLTSQTQHVVIRLLKNSPLPENLIAKVAFVKRSKPKAISLPKAAVLTNEDQQSYWIMKLINDSTAVKVTVKKGLESRGQVEIVAPLLTKTDRILVTGNYGLPDTAKVAIETRIQ